MGHAALASTGWWAGVGGVWGEAVAGARVTKPQGSWAQRGQLLLGFRCPRWRRRGMGTGTTAMPPQPWGSRWANRGEGDLPAGSGAEEVRGSYCRAVVIGGAGRDRGCADGSPRAAGRVPRGGRHGRAKRKRLRTKPRWGWSNWCQPISPRRGPETRAVPEGGHLPRHLRPEAARLGPTPPLPEPRPRRAALGTATGGIQTAWGTPPAPFGAPAVSPGDPWDPAPAKAAGCGNS